MQVLAKNKKAFHDYEVLDNFEAGIALTGTEVKSCRQRNISLADAYAKGEGGELWLYSSHIAPYDKGNRNNHDPRRPRKLLMHKREIQRLAQAVDAKGLTIVPLKMYFNKRNVVKVELGLCRGKNVHDKRISIKRKEDERETRRAIESLR